MNSISSLGGTYHEAADLNGDGVIDLVDYVYLKNQASGLDEINQSIRR